MLFGLVLMYIVARNNQWALDTFHKLSGRFPPCKNLAAVSSNHFFKVSAFSPTAGSSSAFYFGCSSTGQSPCWHTI
jgi:hypothetical protein